LAGSLFGGAMLLSSTVATSAAACGYPGTTDCVPQPGNLTEATVAAAVFRQAVDSFTATVQSHVATSLLTARRAAPTAAATSQGSTDASNPSASGNSGPEAAPQGTGKDRAAAAATKSAPGAAASWSEGGQGALDDSNTDKKYHGTHRIFTVGTDYRLDDHILTGVAIAADDSSLDLESAGGHRAATGGTASAFAGYKFNDTYAASAILGYGHVFNFIALPAGAGWTKDNFGSDRTFLQINASAGYDLGDDLRLVPSVNYTESAERAGSHPGTLGTIGTSNTNTTNLGTARAGAQLNYAVIESFVPFIDLAAEHDLVNSLGSANRTGLVAGAGFLAPVSDHFSLGATTSDSFGRGGQNELQYGVNVRYTW
jgi:hypothetical protein